MEIHKKFIPLSVVLILLFGFFVFPEKTSGQDICDLTDVIFEPNGLQPDEYWRSDKYKKLTFSVTLVGTEFCKGKTFEAVTLSNNASTDDINDLNDVKITFNSNSTRVRFTFWVGEEGCNALFAPDCILYMSVKTPTRVIDSIGPFSKTFPKGALSYVCDNRVNLCDDDKYPIKLLRVEGGKIGTSATTPCRVSATLSPSGTQKEGWYKDDKKPDVKLTIDLINPTECWDKQLKVNLDVPNSVGNSEVPIRDFKIPKNIKKIFLNLKAGENECFGYADPNCSYFIEASGSGIENFSSKGKSNGELKYNCNGLCNDSWQYLSQSTEAYKEDRPIVEPIPGKRPIVEPGKTVSVSFELENPLGKDTDLTRLLNRIGRAIYNLSIPIAVIMILYSGLLWLTAGARPDNVKKAKTVLFYTILGLVVIFIGKGFLTLIKDVLKFGQ